MLLDNNKNFKGDPKDFLFLLHVNLQEIHNDMLN